MAQAVPDPLAGLGGFQGPRDHLTGCSGQGPQGVPEPFAEILLAKALEKPDPGIR